MVLEHVAQKFLMQDVENKDQNYQLNITSLRLRSDFGFLKYNAFSFFNKNIKIISKKLNKKEKNVYLGFKISKKVGKAVVRNKIRRRIRNIIFDISKASNKHLLFDQAILFIPNQNTVNLQYSELNKIIRNGLLFLKKKLIK